jgi:hypothetical protein
MRRGLSSGELQARKRAGAGSTARWVRNGNGDQSLTAASGAYFDCLTAGGKILTFSIIFNSAVMKGDLNAVVGRIEKRNRFDQ